MRTLQCLGAALLAASITSSAGAGDTKTVNVDCGKGETIGDALRHHTLPGRALVVVVKGACGEHVVVTADDTTLRGDGPGGATVSGSDPAQNTILVDGAARVAIDNLLVSGARSGIVATNAASVTVVNAQAKHNAQSGIVALAGALLQGQGDFGLTPTLDTIASNGDAGITVANGGSAEIREVSVTGNGVRGITVSTSGALRIANSTISGNTGDGIGIFNGSSVSVTGNTGSAVLCTGAPSVLIGNTSGVVGPMTGCPPVFP